MAKIAAHKMYRNSKCSAEPALLEVSSPWITVCQAVGYFPFTITKCKTSGKPQQIALKIFSVPFLTAIFAIILELAVVVGLVLTPGFGGPAETTAEKFALMAAVTVTAVYTIFERCMGTFMAKDFLQIWRRFVQQYTEVSNSFEDGRFMISFDNGMILKKYLCACSMYLNY